MLYQRFFSVFLFFVFSSGLMEAQTAAEELQALVKVYRLKSEYNYLMRFDFFADMEIKPRESLTCQSMAKGGLVYYKLSNLEVMTEKGLIVVVNHEDNYVLLDKQDSETGASIQNPESFLKNITQNGQQLTLESTADGKKALKIYEQGNKTPLTTLVYTSAYILEKITTNYGAAYSNYLTGDESDVTRLEINITSLPVRELPLTFSSVLRSKPVYKLTSNYQKYQFFNRLDK